MRNERRNILGTRKQKNDMQMRFLYQLTKQVLKQGTCRSIETDERIVQYQEAGFTHERLGKLELAELPARKKHNVLVEHIMHTEKAEESFLESLILGFGQKLAHQRSNLPVLRMIALLIIVSTVRIAIRIAEGNVFDMVAHQVRPGFVEMILHLVHQQGPASGDDVHQQALASPVRTHQGNVLAGHHAEVHRLLHAVLRMAGYAVIYFYQRFHVSFFRIRWSQR